MNSKRLRLPAAVLAPALLTVACGGGDGDTPVRFEVQTTNMTAAQPLSPLAVVLHDGSDYRALRVGERASGALERLAEGGDNSALLQAADGDDAVAGTTSGTGPLAPGSSATLVIEGTTDAPSLSLVTMLVNTNDAIAAVNAVSLADLAVGESLTVTGLSYDAGTEANTESADTMPGPAAAGGAQEGFNSLRDDVRDEVLVHGGAVTADDGLAGSALDARHRWDHPVIRASITRME